MTEYEENQYWNNRMKTHGCLNTKETRLSAVEGEYFNKYLFYGARVCDYGAGDGKLMPLYEKYNCEVVCFDIVKEWEGMFAKRYADFGYKFNYKYYTQEAYTSLNVENKFDFVFCSAVLMHVRIQFMAWTLNEMKRLAGSGKVVCIAHQNKEDKGLIYDVHNFNYDFENIFKQNNIPIVEYKYENKIAFICY